MEYLIVLWKKI